MQLTKENFPSKSVARAIILFSLLVFAFTASLISFAPLTTHADAESDAAAKACKSVAQESDQALQSSCIGGWESGYSTRAIGKGNGSYDEGVTACTKYGGDPGSTATNVCALGYGLGWQAEFSNHLPDANPVAADQAKICGTGKNATAACKQGVAGYDNNETEAVACKGLKSTNLKNCESAYGSAKKLNPGTAGTTTSPKKPVPTPTGPANPCSTNPKIDASDSLCITSYHCGDSPGVETSIDLGCTGKGNPIMDLIFAVIRFLSDGVGLVLVGSLVYGGIQYSASRGDPQSTAIALNRIRSVGGALLLFIFAYAIINYVVPGQILK